VTDNKFRKADAPPPAPKAPPPDPWGAADEEGFRAWTPQHAAAGHAPVAGSTYLDVVLAHGNPEVALAGHVHWGAQQDNPRTVVRWRTTKSGRWWGLSKWLTK
jgi:hypothetical protein